MSPPVKLRAVGLLIGVVVAVPSVPDTSVAGSPGIGTIGTTVWLDLDGDGTQAPAEPGIPGVRVTATITVGGVPEVLSTSTGGDGKYLFDGVALGDYTVTVDPATLPSGLVNTADPDGGADGTSLVTLADLDPESLVQDFGYRGIGAIGDRVFHDIDGDGADDPGEPGIPGVGVVATMIVGGAPMSVAVTTGADGSYAVNGLPLGPHTATVDADTLPAGMNPTSDLDGIDTPNAATVTLTVDGSAADGLDFGYRGSGTIGGAVWADSDADGVQGTGEPGLAGVDLTITTTIAATPLTYAIRTDAAGTYSFAGLPLGDHAVTVDIADLPAEFTPTADGDDAADGAIDTPGLSLVSLSAAAPGNDRQGFGFRGPGSVGDLVWNDLDGDGLADASEPGIAGVRIDATTSIGGAPVVFSAVTGPDGRYTLPGLPYGDHVIALDATTLPAGSVPTHDGDGIGTPRVSTATLSAGTPQRDDQDFGQFVPAVVGDLVWEDLDGDGVQDQGEPGIGGVAVRLIGADGLGHPVDRALATGDDGGYLLEDVDAGDYSVVFAPPPGYSPSPIEAGGDPAVDSDGPSVPITVVGGMANTSIDAGFVRAASLHGSVWFDRNLDGIPNQGEPGIPGVAVRLTGTTGAGAAIDVQMRTGPTGAWVFAGLPPGVYSLVEAQPVGWADGVESVPGGVPAGDGDVIGPFLVASGARYDGLAFGEVGTTVSGVVSLDGSGTPLAGVTVGLTGVDVLGDRVELSAVTAACAARSEPGCVPGRYLFPGVPPGVYTITQAQPASYASGTVNTGNSIDLVLSGQPVSGNDFTESAGSISGSTYADRNRNGVRDPDETPIPGVKVSLAGLDLDGRALAREVVSDTQGRWGFVDLPAGRYTITETQPRGYIDGQINLGSAGGTTGVNLIEIVLAPGAAATAYGFGEVASSGTLPSTGTGHGPTMLAAFACLIAGSALRLASRRRPAPSS